jgi:hypothetical protein
VVEAIWVFCHVGFFISLAWVRDGRSHTGDSQPDRDSKASIRESEWPLAEAFKAGGLYQGSVHRRRQSMLGTILLVVLILMLFGAIPRWGYNQNWGYGPSGGLGLVLVVVLILVLVGRI